MSDPAEALIGSTRSIPIDFHAGPIVGPHRVILRALRWFPNVVIPSTTLVPMCMSPLPLLRAGNEPATVRSLLSDQLMGLWSEIELERRRRPEVAEIVL